MTKTINWLTRKAGAEPGQLDPGLALEVFKSLYDANPASAEAVFARIQPWLRPVWLQKGDYLLKPKRADDARARPAALAAANNHYLYFVARGLLRCYLAHENGREYNTRFLEEGAVYGDINMMHDDSKQSGEGAASPALFIQAMEPTLAIRTITLAEYRRHSEQDLHFARFSLQCLHQQLLRRQRREQMLQLGSALERYAQLQRLFSPALLARIPQYHLASYVGLNEITFSRAKKVYKQKHSNIN